MGWKIDIKKLKTLRASGSAVGTNGGWDGQGHLSRLYSWYEEMLADHTIDAQPMDSEFNNIVMAGFDNVLTRDGQGSATADIPFNGFKIFNLGAAWGDLTSAVTLKQLVQRDVLMYGTVVEDAQSAVITLDALHSTQKQIPDLQGMQLRAYFFVVILDKNVTADSTKIQFRYADNYPDISAWMVRGMDGYQFSVNTLAGGIPYLVMLKGNSVYVGRLAGGSGGGGGDGGIQTITSPKQSITVINVDQLNPQIDVNLGFFADTDDVITISPSSNGRDWYFASKYKLYSASDMLNIADIAVHPEEARRGQIITFSPQFGVTDNTIISGVNTSGQMIFKSNLQFGSPTDTITVTMGGNTSGDKNLVALDSNVLISNFSGDDTIMIDNSAPKTPRIKVNPAIIPVPPDIKQDIVQWRDFSSLKNNFDWGIMGGLVADIIPLTWYVFALHGDLVYTVTLNDSTNTKHRSDTMMFGFYTAADGTLTGANAEHWQDKWHYIRAEEQLPCYPDFDNYFRSPIFWGLVMGGSTNWRVVCRQEVHEIDEGHQGIDYTSNLQRSKLTCTAISLAAQELIKNKKIIWDLDNSYNRSELHDVVWLNTTYN